MAPEKLLNQEPGSSWLTEFLMSVLQPPDPYTQSPQCTSDHQPSLYGDVLDFSGESFTFAELHQHSHNDGVSMTQNAVNRFAHVNPTHTISSYSSMQNGITLGSQDFQPSFWSFDPFQADGGQSLLEAHRPEIHPTVDEGDLPCEFKLPQATSIEVSSSARDHLIALILSLSESPSVQSNASLMSSFPSKSVLEKLTNRFFSEHVKKVDTFIHAPTFQLSKQPIELWVGMIASVALTSTHSPMRQFGFFLHEVHRASNNKMVRSTSNVPFFQIQLTMTRLPMTKTYGFFLHYSHLHCTWTRVYGVVIDAPWR